MPLLINLIIALVLIGLLWWVIETLSGAFGIPQPIKSVLQVVFVVVVILWLLGAVTGGVGTSGRLYYPFH